MIDERLQREDVQKELACKILGAMGGSKSSPAKRAAAIRNGLLGVAAKKRMAEEAKRLGRKKKIKKLPFKKPVPWD